MRGKAILPVILGMDPPTKDVQVLRTSNPLGGYACIISHADFDEGVQRGDVLEFDDSRSKPKGIACWLQFTDVDVMRKFGQMLIDVADGKHMEGGVVGE